MELNLAVLHEAIADTVPERECLVWRDRRLTWSDVTDRTRRLAAVLRAAGLGRRRALGDRPGWESPHDHLALYLHNGNEYLEGMLGAFKARVAPVNVNYRYVADELASLLLDARPSAVLYAGALAPTLADVLPRLDPPPLLLQVDDGSGQTLLAGAVDYENALAGARPDPPGGLDGEPPSPDDLYVLYTGGTTGAPKGVLWRQADFMVAALGLRRPGGEERRSVADVVATARRGRLRALPAPPFMHGAAHWNALSAWLAGGTVVVQDRTDHLDPADVLATCQREQVTSLLVVGDAFARPLVDELRARPYDLSSLRFLLTGGAALGPALKAELVELVPGLAVVDILGSSETGRQGVHTTRDREAAATSRFDRSADTAVLSADRTRRLAPGEDELGWLAQAGRVPRGYLGDADKTRRTFPTVDGTRYAVAGDRARLAADGRIELVGRDSVTINTGGEKVFAEEVEDVLRRHPSVYDAVVVGRPSARWGEEVVALVRLRPGRSVDEPELREACARHLARYKLPKAVLFLDRIERSPSGKPDYRWARARAGSGS